VRAAEASCGGVFFKVWLYFWLALCSRRSKSAALLGVFQAGLLSVSAMPGLRSPVLLGEVLASPGSKLSQPRSENILRTLTSVFSPKCSFSI